MAGWRSTITFVRTPFAQRPSGRKNFLFIGHPEAGQRSAVIYSVLGSCRRHGINPAEYLQDVFERLPKAKTSDVPALTPAAWAEAKRKAARQMAATYSRAAYRSTTIGSTAFDGRVRDGIGSDRCGTVTKNFIKNIRAFAWGRWIRLFSENYT
jgi:hypothetical protein